MRHPLVAVVALTFAALCAFAPGRASAQANNVYAVAGVYVDVTAANAASAQQAGFASAAQIGFARLAQRVTLPADLAAHGGPPQADQATLDRLVLSTDVEEERRSGTHYIGRLTVNFDPNSVRALLRGQGLTVVDARSAPELVAAVAADGTAPETAALWQQVWSQGGFADELVPLSAAPPALQGAPNWATATRAQAAAATTALYATLRVQGSTATATLVEVSAAGQRDRGAASAQIAGNDAASLRTSLASLAQQASDRIQSDWKSRASVGGSTRSRVSASALYSDERQWEAIKAALSAAAQTLISEIRIEAVGREGALVSFSFVGDRAQLAAELARRGVQLQDTPQGPVLRATATVAVPTPATAVQPTH